jgi:hypothetical protein
VLPNDVSPTFVPVVIEPLAAAAAGASPDTGVIRVEVCDAVLHKAPDSSPERDEALGESLGIPFLAGFLIQDEAWLWRPAVMAKPPAMSIRTGAMARLDAGDLVRTVAQALGFAPSSVVTWSERRRATGSAAPGWIGGHVLRKIRGGPRWTGCAPGWRRVTSPRAAWW